MAKQASKKTVRRVTRSGQAAQAVEDMEQPVEETEQQEEVIEENAEASEFSTLETQEIVVQSEVVTEEEVVSQPDVEMGEEELAHQPVVQIEEGNIEDSTETTIEIVSQPLLDTTIDESASQTDTNEILQTSNQIFTDACMTCGKAGQDSSEENSSIDLDVDLKYIPLKRIFIKPLMGDLFPKGFKGQPWDTLKSKDFTMLFCRDCEQNINNGLAAKEEIERQKKVVEDEVALLRKKTIELFHTDNYVNPENQLLTRAMLGITPIVLPPQVYEVVIVTPSLPTNYTEEQSTNSARPSKRKGPKVKPKPSPTKGPKSKAKAKKATPKKTKATPTKSSKVSNRPIVKPERFRDDDGEDVPDALHDHSDLIAIGDQTTEAPSVKASPRKEVQNIAETENTAPRKRGRPKTKPPKVIKQIQAPKVFAKQIEPGVYSYKDHTFRERPDGKWECDLCHTILKGRHNALIHISNIHLGIGKGEFQCPVCGKSYERQSTLTIHMGLHKKKTNMCQVCGKLFHFKGNLKQHMLIHENTDLPHVCTWEGCGRKFLLPKQLRIHLRRHQDDKPFQCEHCPKKYLNSRELQNHMRTHTGERPFGCHLCSSRFFIKGRLARHLRKVHRISPEDYRNQQLEQHYQEVQDILTMNVPYVVVEL